MGLKKEFKKGIMQHPKLGEIKLEFADKEVLDALEHEKGYAHLFEEKIIKNKK